MPFLTNILINSKYFNLRASRVCSMNEKINGLINSMKSLFKEKPVTFILSSSVAIFSYSFRIAECEFISQDTFTAYMNMWMTTITMKTVGFGDYKICNPIFQLVGVLCMSWGGADSFSNGLFMAQALTLNSRQNQSLVILKRLLRDKQVNKAAANCIRVDMWRLWKRKKLIKSLKYDLIEHENKKKVRHLRVNYQSTKIQVVEWMFIIK